MRKVKKEKTVEDKLNRRQLDAIQKAQQGDSFPLIQVCLECYKAEDKALAVQEMGVVRWGANTAFHYQQLRQYLESFMDNDTTWKAYQLMVEGRTNNG